MKRNKSKQLKKRFKERQAITESFLFDLRVKQKIHNKEKRQEYYKALYEGLETEPYVLLEQRTR